MKKVLFATTALIATASVAAADVRISGYGRFGLSYNEGNDRGQSATTGQYLAGAAAFNGRNETNITSRLRLQFDMSTETDNGVAFGARFRAQAESRNNAPGGAAFNGARFFASYEGFTLQVGNIIGAIENMPGLYLETRTAGIGIDGAGFQSVVTNVNGHFGGGPGSLSESFNWDAYSSGGSGANGVEVLYSANGFTGHISYSADNVAPSGVKTSQIARTAAMVAYNFGDWTAALSFQDSKIAFQDKAVFSVSGNLGQFGVRFAYADNEGIDKYGLYGNMDIGAASNILIYVTSEGAVSAADIVAGRGDNRDASASNSGVNGKGGSEGTGYGIHYSYDLGGGVSFEAGARQASWDNTSAQAGVYFSF